MGAMAKKKKKMYGSVLFRAKTHLFPSCWDYQLPMAQRCIPHWGLSLASDNCPTQGYVSPRTQLGTNVWLTQGYKGPVSSSIWYTLRVIPLQSSLQG